MAPKISAKKSSDISRNTILILLILTIILTIILSGIITWVILDTLDNVKQHFTSSSLQSPSVSLGQIMVGILPNPDLIREIPR